MQLWSALFTDAAVFDAAIIRARNIRPLESARIAAPSRRQAAILLQGALGLDQLPPSVLIANCGASDRREPDIVSVIYR